MRWEAAVIAFLCVVMIEKWRAPSIIRKAISRQLWSTTASETLQPSSLALAMPAESIFMLASSVRRWLGTKLGMVGDPFSPRSPHESTRGRHEQLVDRHRLGDDALCEGMIYEFFDHAAVLRDAVGQRIA